MEAGAAFPGPLAAHRAALVEFFSSPAGLVFLHALVVVLLTVFCKSRGAGTGQVRLVLRTLGLAAFVATSRSSLATVGHSIEHEAVAFEQHQRPILAAALAAREKPKPISLVEDETFHPKICVVAIEALSDMILLEEYVEKRDADTWNSQINAALTGLNVLPVQTTSDQAKGLLKHAEEGLGVHHNADLFHGQHELSRGVSPLLAKQTRDAEKAVAAAKEFKTITLPQNEAEWRNSKPEYATRDFAPRFAEADIELKEAEAQLEAARSRQKRVTAAIRGVGDDYHPIDLQTGAPVTPDQLQAKLEKRFDEISAVANEAKLPDYSLKAVAKARRLVPEWVATITFFFGAANALIGELGITPDLTRAVFDHLLPAAYLRRAAKKARDSAAREVIEATLQRIAALPSESATALALLPLAQRVLLEHVIADCADLFQRASSLVEGRNGQLSLIHHGLHRLSTSTLRFLTIYHNYAVRRRDGTTPAQRFFGVNHDDLFEWMLNHVKLPACPRGPPLRRAQTLTGSGDRGP